MSILGIPFRMAGSSGYVIGNSLWLDGSADHLTRTPGGAGNRKTWTYSVWIKQIRIADGSKQNSFSLSANQDTNNWFADFRFSTGKINWYSYSTGGSFTGRLTSTPAYLDPTGWINVVLVQDTTQATAADRTVVFVDGVQVTDYDTATYPPLNAEGPINNTGLHRLFTDHVSPGGMCEAYVAEVVHLDGHRSTDASEFGEFDANGKWVPVDPSGLTFGTNGFWLDFAVAPGTGNGAGTDVSGNGNHFTDVSLTAAQQSTDSPTDDAINDVGNFCVLSPHDHPHKVGTPDLRNGNLTAYGPSANEYNVRGTLPFMSGKKFFALTASSTTGGDYYFGVCDVGGDFSGNWDPGSAAAGNHGYRISFNSGTVVAGKGNGSALGSTFSGFVNDTDMPVCAIDADAGEIYMGVWDSSANAIVWLANDGGTDGDPAAGLNPTWSGLTGRKWVPIIGMTRSGSYVDIDFGQNNWAGHSGLVPPAGFEMLHTGNLTAPAVKSMSEGVVSAKALGSAIVADLDTAKADAGWGSDAHIDVYLVRGSTQEGTQWVFSDDASNALVLQTNAAATAFASLISGDNYLGYSMRVGAKYGLFTTTQAHTNGAGDTSIAHGLGTNAKVGIMKMSSATGEWTWTHPALTANYNVAMSTDNVETATQHVDVDDTNIIIKSAAPTGTYRVVVFEEIEGFLDINQYIGDGSATDGPYIPMHIKPELGFMTHIDVSGGYGRYFHQRLGARTYNTGNTGLFHDVSTNSAKETDAIWAGEDFYGAGVKVGSISNEVNGSGKRYLTLMHGNPVGGSGVAQPRAR